MVMGGEHCHKIAPCNICTTTNQYYYYCIFYFIAFGLFYSFYIHFFIYCFACVENTEISAELLWLLLL